MCVCEKCATVLAGALFVEGACVCVCVDMVRFVVSVCV